MRFNAQDVVGAGDMAVDLVSQANAQRDKQQQQQNAAPPAAAPRRRRRKPKIDQWERVAFNSKVPRWARSAFRAFADEEDYDLQDLHAIAMLVLMEARGFDVESYLPDPEVNPAPEDKARLVELLELINVWPPKDVEAAS